jgi:hypothetical protein
LLANTTLHGHFQSEATIEAFWKLLDPNRRALWGTPVDLDAREQEHKERYGFVKS